MKDKNKIINKLAESIAKAKQEAQKLPNQYVVEYRRVDNDELIGYHLSTFCQTTQDILDAKRYQGDSPYKQLEVISKNLDTVFKDKPTVLTRTLKSIKENYFKGYKREDIYLKECYLADGTQPQNSDVGIIN